MGSSCNGPPIAWRHIRKTRTSDDSLVRHHDGNGLLWRDFRRHRSGKTFQIRPRQIVNLALLCFLGGVIGARLYFVALSWPEFAAHPQEIIWSPTEGLSIRGSRFMVAYLVP